MKAQIIGLILAALVSISFLSAYSQNTGDTLVYRVETIDGNEFIGRIVFEDEEKIILNTTTFGELSIPRSSVKRLSVIKPERIIEGVHWFENPQASRYFWAPNGYGLKAGEGYYQNIYVFYNQFSYGASDYFSIGAGIIPLFLFAGTSTPIWLVPKFSIPVLPEKFNLGLGAMVGTVIGESQSGFGILYGTGTFGTRDKNFSIGLGWGYLTGSFARKPLVNASAIFRVTARSYFISENYYIPAEKDMVILSIGGRSMIRNVSIDYMLAVPVANTGDVFLIPLLGIAVPFGNTIN